MLHYVVLTGITIFNPFYIVRSWNFNAYSEQIYILYNIQNKIFQNLLHTLEKLALQRNFPD